MNNTYAEKILVRDTDVDFSSKVPVPVLMKLTEQVVFTHAYKMGLDHTAMIKNSNAFWIVSKIKLVINSQIESNKKISIKTWTEQPGVLKFLRDWEIKSGGRINVKGVSEWCCLDWTTRRPRKADSISYPKLDMATNKSLNLTFTNMRLDVDEKDYVYSRKILSTDIDVNFHTNNLRYNYFAFDAFSVEELKQMEIEEYEVYFVTESKEGDLLDIYKRKIKNHYYIEGKSQNKTIFRSVIKFKSKK